MTTTKCCKSIVNSCVCTFLRINVSELMQIHKMKIKTKMYTNCSNNKKKKKKNKLKLFFCRLFSSRLNTIHSVALANEHQTLEWWHFNCTIFQMTVDTQKIKKQANKQLATKEVVYVPCFLFSFSSSSL